jgi:hypothetical protein
MEILAEAASLLNVVMVSVRVPQVKQGFAKPGRAYRRNFERLRHMLPRFVGTRVGTLFDCQFLPEAVKLFSRWSLKTV